MKKYIGAVARKCFQLEFVCEIGSFENSLCYLSSKKKDTISYEKVNLKYALGPGGGLRRESSRILLVEVCVKKEPIFYCFTLWVCLECESRLARNLGVIIQQVLVSCFTLEPKYILGCRAGPPALGRQNGCL